MHILDCNKYERSSYPVLISITDLNVDVDNRWLDNICVQHVSTVHSIHLIVGLKICIFLN